MFAIPASRFAELPQPLAEGLQRPHLPALDGLRAIAALLVVYYHLSSPLVPGGLGVLSFFVLSGFLITWLLLAEREKHGSVSLLRFYARRALRIFPAFYAYWLLAIGALLFLGKSVIWPQAVSALFYVNNYYQALAGDPNTLLSHTWSLGIEEQFYLLWPAAFLFLASDYRRLVRCLTGAVLTVWIYRAALVIAQRPSGYIYEAFDTRADHLLVGCLLAVVLRAGLMAPLWRFLTRSVLPSLLLVTLLAGSVVLEDVLSPWPYRDLVGFVVNPCIIALLIPTTIGLSTSALWSWLNTPWMKYLGTISYSLYLYQQIVPDLVHKIVPDWGGLGHVAAGTVLVIALASGSYFLVERPFLRLKSRYSAR